MVLYDIWFKLIFEDDNDEGFRDRGFLLALAECYKEGEYAILNRVSLDKFRNNLKYPCKKLEMEIEGVKYLEGSEEMLCIMKKQVGPFFYVRLDIDINKFGEDVNNKERKRRCRIVLEEKFKDALNKEFMDCSRFSRCLGYINLIEIVKMKEV